MHSYWTDNGACYYGTTGSQYTNNEDLFVAVKEDADKSGIPYCYVQVIVSSNQLVNECRFVRKHL